MPNDLAPFTRELPAVASAEEVVKAWLTGKSARTLGEYSLDLNDFRRFVKAPTSVAAAELLMTAGPAAANRCVLEYRADMIDRRGLKSNTVARRLATLRSLIKLGRQLGMINWSIDIQGPRIVPYRDTRGPGLEGWLDIEATARKPSKRDPDGRLAKRNTALVGLMFDLALRRSEVAALDLGDVDLDAREGRGEIHIIAKGRTEKEPRTIGSEPLRAALAEWIAARGSAPGALFIRLDRARDRKELKRISGHSVDRVIKALSRRAGLKWKAHAHGLRHQAITTALDDTGGNVRQVRMLSGHSRVETVMIYDDRRRDDAGDVSELLGRHRRPSPA
jgi:integrase/recombinase XerC